jgi:hypothetical protein
VKRDKRAQAIPALDLAAVGAGEARVDLDPQDDAFDLRGLRTARSGERNKDERERVTELPRCQLGHPPARESATPLEAG